MRKRSPGPALHQKFMVECYFYTLKIKKQSLVSIIFVNIVVIFSHFARLRISFLSEFLVMIQYIISFDNFNYAFQYQTKKVYNYSLFLFINRLMWHFYYFARALEQFHGIKLNA